MSKILSINSGNELVADNGSATMSVADAFEFNSNRLMVTAGSTKTVTPYFEMLNGDKMTCFTPAGQILIGTSFSFSVLAGEVIYFVPVDGVWDNLTYIDFSSDNYIFDLSEFVGKINSVHTVILNSNPLLTGDAEVFKNVSTQVSINFCELLTVKLEYFDLETLGIQDCGATGDISDMSVSRYCYIYRNPLITGNINEIDPSEYYSADFCPLLTGDPSLLSATSTVSMNGVNLLSGGIPPNASVFVRITAAGIVDDISASIATDFLQLTGTGVYANTGTGVVPETTIWFDSDPAIPESALLTRIQRSVDSNIQDGRLSIGSNNVAITDATGLANIATLQARGWTVTYNT